MGTNLPAPAVLALIFLKHYCCVQIDMEFRRSGSQSKKPYGGRGDSGPQSKRPRALQEDDVPSQFEEELAYLDEVEAEMTMDAKEVQPAHDSVPIGRWRVNAFTANEWVG